MKSSQTKFQTTVLVALAAAAVGCLWLSEVALFVLFLTLLAWLTLKPASKRFRRRAHWALAFAAVLSSVGLLRFVAEHALAGMLTAGKANLDKGNVSRLREILFAQDQARERAIVDPDRDGVGSALFIQGLAGAETPRATNGEHSQLLDRRFTQIIDTKIGPAASINGYLFAVCLPHGEGSTAQPNTPVDEERAEREFIAYAWPLARNVGNGKLFAIDQHERIMESDNGGATGPLFWGSDQPPPCDGWQRESLGLSAWKGKQPRDRLPGDRPAQGRP